jgi:predicted DCC family thiol-disulfide oxidoreductase YuxK
MSSSALKRLAPRLPKNLVLFDGRCYYCNHTVQWVIEHNLKWPKASDNVMHFCPLESPDAQFVLSHFPQSEAGGTIETDTLILIENRSPYFSDPTTPAAPAAPGRATNASTAAAAASRQQKQYDEATEEGGSHGDDSGKKQVEVYTGSAAMFRIGMKLDAPIWSSASTLGYYVLPRPCSDFFYNRIAARRYERYGKASACIAPSPEMKLRYWQLEGGAM